VTCYREDVDLFESSGAFAAAAILSAFDRLAK
jgi:hypothetical protein